MRVLRVALVVALAATRVAAAPGEDGRLAATVAYGGAFADNVGVTGEADLGWFGGQVGAGYAHYLTLLAGPRVSVTLPTGRWELALLYTVDATSAGDASLWLHLLTLSTSLTAPLSERLFVRAELALARYPLAAHATQGGRSHDVPLSSIDASWFLPGLGIGLRL
jgi:hypothetical protein